MVVVPVGAMITDANVAVVEVVEATTTACCPTEFVGEGRATVVVVATGGMVGEFVGVDAAVTVIVCVAVAAK